MPLSALVKPPVTFKYMQCHRFGLCLWKNIIDSYELLYLLHWKDSAFKWVFSKICHIYHCNIFQTPELLKGNNVTIQVEVNNLYA